MEELLYSPEFRALLQLIAGFSTEFISSKIGELLSDVQKDTAEAKRLRKKYTQLIQNDDLQRGVRKAQLHATLRVLEKALEEAPEHKVYFQKITKAFSEEIEKLNAGASMPKNLTKVSADDVQQIATNMSFRQDKSGDSLKLTTLAEIKKHPDWNDYDAFAVITKLLLKGWQDGTHEFDWFIAFSHYFAELRHDDPKVKDAFDTHLLGGIASQLGLNHGELLAGVDKSTQSMRQAVQDDGSLTRATIHELSEEMRGYFDKLLKKPADALPEAALKPDASHLPELATDFVFPLSLGVEVTGEATERDRHRTPYEIQLYGEDRDFYRSKRFETRPAQAFLDEWRNQAGVYVVTGEPGGGKTTLLSHWACTLHKAYLQDDSQPFPLYIPLREMRDVSRKELIDKGVQRYFERFGIWGYEIDVTPYRQGKRNAIWLLDGWDELEQDQQRDWVKLVKALSGVVVVSCRVAQYNGDFGRGHVIMGLSQQEQVAFLEKLTPSLVSDNVAFEDADDGWRRSLVEQVNQHVHLRQLASNPLLLTLVARTNPPGNIQLPRKRADFYQQAVDEMIDRKLSLKLRSKCKLKRTLVEIAKQAKLALSISEKVLCDALEAVDAPDDVEEQIRSSGVLRPKGKGYEFLHATFQEWHLAQALNEEGTLLDAVEVYWWWPSYEETLSLLWGIKSAKEQFEATEFLSSVGCKRLSDRGVASRECSGFRTLLLFWQRSGLEVEEESLKYIWAWMNPDQESASLRSVAVTLQEEVPTSILKLLSCSTDKEVRRLVAERRNIPPEVLQQLMQDSDTTVRATVLKRHDISIPQATYLALVNDQSPTIRAAIASNSKTPAPMLEILAKDKNDDVRTSLVRNENVELHLLEKLAKDKSYKVRAAFTMWVMSMPIQVVRALAEDESEQIRYEVARNPELPDSILAVLSKDKSKRVRQQIAKNIYSDAIILTNLAEDKSLRVRWQIARNHKTPIYLKQKIEKSLGVKLLNLVYKKYQKRKNIWQKEYDKPLEERTKSKDTFTRVVVAIDKEAPAILLEELASDRNSWVREKVAKNLNTSSSTLAILAQDSDVYVRLNALANPNLCLEHL